MDVVITRSKKKDRKLDAIIDGKKTVSFGAKGMSDMTIHKDPERKKRYVSRRKRNENWNEPKTGGRYAKHVLRNKKHVASVCRRSETAISKAES